MGQSPQDVRPLGLPPAPSRPTPPPAPVAAHRARERITKPYTEAPTQDVCIPPVRGVGSRRAYLLSRAGSGRSVRAEGPLAPGSRGHAFFTFTALSHTFQFFQTQQADAQLCSRRARLTFSHTWWQERTRRQWVRTLCLAAIRSRIYLANLPSATHHLCPPQTLKRQRSSVFVRKHQHRGTGPVTARIGRGRTANAEQRLTVLCD